MASSVSAIDLRAAFRFIIKYNTVFKFLIIKKYSIFCVPINLYLWHIHKLYKLDVES